MIFMKFMIALAKNEISYEKMIQSEISLVVNQIIFYKKNSQIFMNKISMEKYFLDL